MNVCVLSFERAVNIDSSKFKDYALCVISHIYLCVSDVLQWFSCILCDKISDSYTTMLVIENTMNDTNHTKIVAAFVVRT